MRRSKRFGQTLTTKGWLNYRPYNEFFNYDGYYLKLANSVFEYLNKPGNGLRDIFDRELLKEIAVVTTCHFEDFISKIGIWPALVRKHEELHGQVLPFYDLEDYDKEYLNPQDFAYLIWHHLGKLANKTLDPYAPVLLQAADFCYAFFEKRIDEAPATDFYDDWLDISSDINFFDLKRRLIGMTFENYLTGPENNLAMKGEVERLFESRSEMLEKMDPGMLIYAIQNSYLIKKNFSWCAMTAPDWLAEVARCPEGLKSDIRRLSHQVQGIFLYEDSDEQYYHFQFVPSGRSFPIRRESIDIDVKDMKAGRDTAFFGIVPWQGDWWLSGTFMGWGEPEKGLDEIRTDPSYASFYGWTKEQQQQLREMTAEMEETFISYFGERLVLFPNEKALAKAMEEQREWWNEQKAKEQDSKKSKSGNKERPTMWEDFDLGGGAVAAFFEPDQGVTISTLVPDIVDQLQKKHLTREESQNLFYGFFIEFSPALAHYIAEHYPMDNLRFPLRGDWNFVKDHFEFFLRYYNPGSFGETVPNLTLLPEERNN